jgi:hypothetical protein
MWKDTSYGVEGHANKEPWCATLICHCLAQAAREGWTTAAKSLPKEASVRFFLQWAQKRPGVEVFKPGSRPLLPNDIVVFLPRLSHIGILERVEGSTLHTIEGNTNPAGSREGDGVYRKTRALSFPGHIIRFL